MMGMKIRSQQQHHPVALRFHEQMGTKRKYTFIQAQRNWLPKYLLLWIMVMLLISWCIYKNMDAGNKVKRRETLGSLCEQRARMLQDQFSVSVNHVHALAILVSTFHYYINPSAIDQVCVLILNFCVDLVFNSSIINERLFVIFTNLFMVLLICLII